ncbi:MAG TPA: hypothetical protein VNB90_10635 [Cytophagaceae bacterium]|jgi:hypothetical protein|nr:hypothetical protein [Cytophagaceae bacterium]
MSKIQTTLNHFRFLSDGHEKEHYKIIWYKLEENEDNSESYGVCFNEEEQEQFINFTRNSDNFHHPHISSCDHEKTPGCGTYELEAVPLKFPMNLILRRKPIISSQPDKIRQCMDIQLLKEDGTPLDHTLPFDIIGEIIQ